MAFTWTDEGDHAVPEVPETERDDWRSLVTALMARHKAITLPVMSEPFSLSHVEVALSPDSLRPVLRHIGQLCVGFGASPPDAEEFVGTRDLGDFHVAWRCFDQGVSISIVTENVNGTLLEPAFKKVPSRWRAGLGGTIVAAIEVTVEDRSAPQRTFSQTAEIFGTRQLCGSRFEAGAVVAVGDFAEQADKQYRFILRDVRLGVEGMARFLPQLIDLCACHASVALLVDAGERRDDWAERVDSAIANLLGSGIVALDPEEEVHTIASLGRIGAELMRREASFGDWQQSRSVVNDISLKVNNLGEQRIDGLMSISERIRVATQALADRADSQSELMRRLGDKLDRAQRLLGLRTLGGIAHRQSMQQAALRALAARQNRLARLVGLIAVILGTVGLSMMSEWVLLILPPTLLPFPMQYVQGGVLPLAFVLSLVLVIILGRRGPEH